MKKRINLLKQNRYVGNEKLIKRIMLSATVIGLIIFIIFLFLNYLNLRTGNQIKDLNSEKQKALIYLLENKDNEAKLQYFKSKENQLIKYNKNDAHFLPYYEVLEKAIQPASNSSTLDSIDIDKDRNVSFTVRFNDFQATLNFLKYVESDTFLNNFNRLVLSNINLIDLSKNYQFTFNGNFKEINDNLF